MEVCMCSLKMKHIRKMLPFDFSETRKFCLLEEREREHTGTASALLLAESFYCRHSVLTALNTLKIALLQNVLIFFEFSIFDKNYNNPYNFLMSAVECQFEQFHHCYVRPSR